MLRAKQAAAARLNYTFFSDLVVPYLKVSLCKILARIITLTIQTLVLNRRLGLEFKLRKIAVIEAVLHIAKLAVDGDLPHLLKQRLNVVAR